MTLYKTIGENEMIFRCYVIKSTVLPELNNLTLESLTKKDIRLLLDTNTSFSVINDDGYVVYNSDDECLDEVAQEVLDYLNSRSY